MEIFWFVCLMAVLLIGWSYIRERLAAVEERVARAGAGLRGVFRAELRAATRAPQTAPPPPTPPGPTPPGASQPVCVGAPRAAGGLLIARAAGPRRTARAPRAPSPSRKSTPRAPVKTGKR